MLLKEKILTSDNALPHSYEEENKMLKNLGLGCISYHACLNDCILYIGE